LINRSELKRENKSLSYLEDVVDGLVIVFIGSDELKGSGDD